MEIALRNIKVKEIVNGFENKQEEGVIGFGGKLTVNTYSNKI